jgi:tRNA (guanosine-2'-O-)-methyltransferase
MWPRATPFAACARSCSMTEVPKTVMCCLSARASPRSCDAVGIDDVHLVYTLEDEPELSRVVAASAQKWLRIHRHSSIADCYSSLRESGFTIFATALMENCRDLHELDLTGPTAFVFGNEMRGCSQDAVDLADAAMTIPMVGMVQSLNISVACAVTLYEALRQRCAAGHYDAPKLIDEVRRERLESWLRREGRSVPEDSDA